MKYEIAIESFRHPDPTEGLRFFAMVYETAPPNEEAGEELPTRADLKHRGTSFSTHDEAAAYAKGWVDCNRNTHGST